MESNQINSSTSNAKQGQSSKNPEEDKFSKSTDEDSNPLFSLGVVKKQVFNEQAGQVEEVDATILTNIELIKKAEAFTENLELEKAVTLYDEGLRRFPNDTVIMDAYTDLLLQMDSHQKARELIERSIQLNPNQEGRKYLNCG